MQIKSNLLLRLLLTMLVVAVAAQYTISDYGILAESVISAYATDAESSVSADKKSRNINFEPECYEGDENSHYMVGQGYKVDEFVYGKNSLGQFCIGGFIDNETEYNGYKAYSVTGDVTLSYKYDGSFQTGDKGEWRIYDSDDEKVSGYDFNKDIKKGAWIVQRSKTGKDTDWTTMDSHTDIFKDKTIDLIDFRSIDEKTIREGYFYRVIFAYEMSNDTIISKDRKIREETEVYRFYLSYGDDPVTLKSLNTRETVSENEAVKDGFIIDKGGSDFDVSVIKDNNSPVIADDIKTVSEPGKYKVCVKSKLGDEYTHNITVTDGTEMLSISPKLYEGGEKGKYSENPPDRVTGKSSFGESALTDIKLCQNYGKPIRTGKVNDVDAYGFSGDSMSIFMSLKSPDNSRFCSDDYGAKEKETIYGVKTGKVKTGALIIKKSKNGTDWENVEQGALAKGLSTTDYSKSYKDKGDKLIYTPDGTELINGLYLKVIFAYELKNNDDKSRFIEVYNIYLCSNDLEAVTFHNLSVNDEGNETAGADDEVNIKIKKHSETLLSGSGTVTGFQVDTSLRAR